MKYTVLSRIVDGSALKGFTIIADTGHVHFVELDAITAICMLSDITFYNATFNREFKTLEGTQGSLSSYPSIDKSCNLVGRNGLVVYKTILDKDTEKPIGCQCFNATGVRYNLSYKKISELLRVGNIACNFDFKVINGIKMAVPKNGGQFETIKIEVKKKAAMYDSSKGEAKPEVEGKQNLSDSSTGKRPPAFNQEDNSELPTVKVYGLDDDNVYTSDFRKSADEKLMMAKLNLLSLSPYYHCILNSIKVKPLEGFGTMGVTEDTMYYDMEFVAGLSVPELTFVLIHEMLHIAMQHSARFGNREYHNLWNIATDLYINSIICKDFGVDYQGTVKNYEADVEFNGKTTHIKAELQAPKFGVYLESINETLDLAKDTPETIYSRLLKENKDKMQNSGGGGGGQGVPQQGQGQSQSGQSGQSGGQQGQQGSSQQGQGQSGSEQGDNSGGQGGQDQNGQGNQNGQDQNGQGGQNGQNQNQNQNGQGNGNGDDEDVFNNANSQNGANGGGDLDSENDTSGNNQIKDVNVTYNGKKLQGKIITDVMSNVQGKGKEANKQRVDSSVNALSKMNVKVRLEKEKQGVSELSKGFSQSGGGLTQRYIEFGISAGVDWRVILRNVSKKNPKKTFTLGHPNQDYMSMGMTIADRRRIGKPEEIRDIKVCVDVSGSVDQKTLNYYLSEVNNIFNYYKVKGELIYWSTEVGDAGDFASMKDMLKVQPNSTGGTDAKCVFDYLTGKVKTSTGKSQMTKPRDISLVLIITDGYFAMNFGEYAKNFSGRTVWLIDGNPVTSEIPFGKILAINEDPKRKQ